MGLLGCLVALVGSPVVLLRCLVAPVGCPVASLGCLVFRRSGFPPMNR